MVTAFETYLKTLYGFIVRVRIPDQAEAFTSKKAVGNAFQNIERGRKLYAPLGIDPFALCSSEEMDVLDRNIQKRDVIGHNLGLADDAYAEKQREATRGTTVEVTPAEITHFAGLCAGVVAHVVVTMASDVRGGAESTRMSCTANRAFDPAYTVVAPGLNALGSV